MCEMNAFIAHVVSVDRLKKFTHRLHGFHVVSVENGYLSLSELRQLKTGNVLLKTDRIGAFHVVSVENGYLSLSELRQLKTGNVLLKTDRIGAFHVVSVKR